MTTNQAEAPGKARALLAKLRPKTKIYVCKDCGYVGPAKGTYRGNACVHFVIAAFLSVFFIVPGVIYWLWAVSTIHNVCPECGGESIIPVDSPMGKKLVEEHGFGQDPSQTLDKVTKLFSE
jgi:predicted RNA-binding Zn-ribbon protein involved in translation (DUF1610 family)